MSRDCVDMGEEEGVLWYLGRGVWRGGGLLWGRGCSRQGLVEPVEVIQFISPLRCPPYSSGLCVETCDGHHTFPDLPHVVFPELLLNLSFVAVLGFLHALFLLLLCCFDGRPLSGVITWLNSLGRYYGRRLTASSSKSQQRETVFTEKCPGTNGCWYTWWVPHFCFSLLGFVSLLSLTAVNPGRSMLTCGTRWFSHEQATLSHSLSVIWIVIIICLLMCVIFVLFCFIIF